MVDRILSHRPEWVCLSLLTYLSQHPTRWLCFLLKQRCPDVKIVIGGPGCFSSLKSIDNYANSLKTTGLIDHYIAGDGEQSLPALISGHDNYAGIDHLDWQEIEDLNQLAPPDYSDYLWSLYKVKRVSIYVNNKLHHDVLQPNFFQKRNIENVYNAILCNTSFLNDYAPSLRERIFYIENGYTDIKRCGYCEINKLKFNGKTNPFSKTCLSPECVSKHRTAVAFKKWSSNPRRIQYIDSKCIGCGCIYKKPKQSR
jgi:hypothetical protein